MYLCYLTHPTATLSRGIENLVIYGEHSNRVVKIGCDMTARIISAIVFPIFLTSELIFKRCPKVIHSVGTEKFQQKVDKALGYFLAIIPSIVLGIYSPALVPGFFLKRQKTDREICPFGVERVFGKTIEEPICYPKSIQDVQNCVRQTSNKISVIGAGMSQGVQTIPKDSKGLVIDTRYLNRIQVNQNTMTVEAGATWEQVQLALDQVNKSAIVKQASDLFSIGGSIGINCHGWAHEYGAISKTVQSLKVVDAKGDLRVLNRPRQGVPLQDLTDDEKLFKCMFGTLGYFGIIVEATLEIVDNEMVTETMVEVDASRFFEVYNQQTPGGRTPLFGGRLTLDMLEGDPLRTICMNGYQKCEAVVNRPIVKEPKWGTRVQRIGLTLFSHLPDVCVTRFISYFWKQNKAAMSSNQVLTRNEALHPPINMFKMLYHSDLHTEWLQEYFIKQEHLVDFLKFLGKILKENHVRLINATIRPTPKDEISILPYAEQDRYGVVICFAQKKTEAEILKTKTWIEKVNAYLVENQGIFYQAYMPYASKEQFEACYGKERVEQMRELKAHFDPQSVFGNAHTAKYYTVL